MAATKRPRKQRLPEKGRTAPHDEAHENEAMLAWERKVVAEKREVELARSLAKWRAEKRRRGIADEPVRERPAPTRGER